MDTVTFEVIDQDDLIRTIDRMVEGLKPEKIEPLLEKGASDLAAAVRKETPVGPTGNLKKAVKKKKLKRFGKNPAPSIAAIDRKRGKGFHGHLVHQGTKGIRQVSPSRLVNIDGKRVRITNTGKMPANPFFARAVGANQEAVLKKLESGIGKLLEDAMK